MIVLNGAQGLSEALAQALSQGITGLQMARSILAGGHTGPAGSDNGHTGPAGAQGGDRQVEAKPRPSEGKRS